MERYKLILTGGTIGAQSSISGIKAIEDTEILLLEKYKEKGGKLCFETVRVANMLSENFSTRLFQHIAKMIVQAATQDCCGVVVTSGSDNIAALSVYLAFALVDVQCPVFVISSQYPLTDSKENGSDNLLAVDTVKSVLKRGVYILNRNLAEDFVSVHVAARVGHCKAFTGDIESINGLIGKVKASSFYRNKEVFEEVEQFYGNAVDSSPLKDKKIYHFDLGDVLAVFPSAFSAPELPDRLPKAVFFHLCHSGTAPVTGDVSVVPFLKRCKVLGIPVFAAPAFFDKEVYETTLVLKELGVLFIRNTASLAAEIKVRIAFSENIEKEARVGVISTCCAAECIGVCE